MDIFQELEAALGEVKKQAGALQNEVVALRRERQGEVWYYQGDGEDKLESLTCPVLIEAADLRAIVQRRDKLQEDLDRYLGEPEGISVGEIPK